MKPMPFEFETRSQSSAGIGAPWLAQSETTKLSISIPTEFSGPGGALSPEDLFNHALTNCFVGTFKVYAENSKLSFEKISSNSRLVVDVDQNKKPVMKEFFLSVEILNPSDPDKALVLAKKAAASGFIINSVKTKCHFDFKVSSSKGTSL